MKTSISAAMQTHLDGNVTKLATCWKLTRSDSTVVGFTDHDVDIIYSGTTYKAATGLTASDIQAAGGTSVDNLEIAGMITSAGVTEADIDAGVYDDAAIEIFMLRWDEATSSPPYASGTIPLRKGWLGEVRRRNGQFVAEMRGLAQAYQQHIGDVYGLRCTADFADSLTENKCKLVAATYTVTDTVAAITTDKIRFTTGLSQADGYFTGGFLTWTSGNNNGLKMEVRRYLNASGDIELYLPMPYTIQAGDTFSIIRGCDKTFETCRDTFSNEVNFRGFPFIPGTDEFLKAGSQ